MDAVAAQWIGQRSQQEDAYLVKYLHGGLLAVVCDGMGGHSCGKLAADAASETFVAAFAQTSETDSVPDRLNTAVNKANEAVAKLFEGKDLYGGCTLTAVFVRGSSLWWVSVGDSPLLIWRGRHLTRLNADHSMRSLYVDYARSGIISYKEAMAHGHMLRSSLTGEKIALLDLPQRSFMLLPGDRLVLASDGVENLLLAPALSLSARQALDSPFLQTAVGIVEACRALNNEYADNVTVVVMNA